MSIERTPGRKRVRKSLTHEFRHLICHISVWIIVYELLSRYVRTHVIGSAPFCDKEVFSFCSHGVFPPHPLPLQSPSTLLRGPKNKTTESHQHPCHKRLWLEKLDGLCGSTVGFAVEDMKLSTCAFLLLLCNGATTTAFNVQPPRQNIPGSFDLSSWSFLKIGRLAAATASSGFNGGWEKNETSNGENPPVTSNLFSYLGGLGAAINSENGTIDATFVESTLETTGPDGRPVSSKQVPFSSQTSFRAKNNSFLEADVIREDEKPADVSGGGLPRNGTQGGNGPEDLAFSYMASSARNDTDESPQETVLPTPKETTEPKQASTQEPSFSYLGGLGTASSSSGSGRSNSTEGGVSPNAAFSYLGGLGVSSSPNQESNSNSDDAKSSRPKPRSTWTPFWTPWSAEVETRDASDIGAKGNDSGASPPLSYSANLQGPNTPEGSAFASERSEPDATPMEQPEESDVVRNSEVNATNEDQNPSFNDWYNTTVCHIHGTVSCPMLLFQMEDTHTVSLNDCYSCSKIPKIQAEDVLEEQRIPEPKGADQTVGVYDQAEKIRENIPTEKSDLVTVVAEKPKKPKEPNADKLKVTGTPITVQGGSLKTWSFASSMVKRVQVTLTTEGRPLDADVDLWQGPDNTPHQMRLYVQDGLKRPVKVILETPRSPNTIAVRNTGQMEFPLAASVEADTSDEPLAAELAFSQPKQTIQGGALRTYPFDSSVESVQVLLMTDGRPLNARIELLQGPNNNKQVFEVYTEDGEDRPFFTVIESPGSGNVVRVVNTATVEFPLYAWVAPFRVTAAPGPGESFGEPILGGGDDTASFQRDWSMAKWGT